MELLSLLLKPLLTVLSNIIIAILETPAEVTDVTTVETGLETIDHTDVDSINNQYGGLLDRR